MTLIRALSAEMLKLKRTIALKMVVLAPLTVILLTLFMASQAPFSTLRGSAATDHWGALARVNLQFWGLLMLPLYLTLETALTAGLDHTDNQWKALFARPMPRWATYVAKLVVVQTMAAASGALLVLGVVLEGIFLQTLHPELRFVAQAPLGLLLRQVAEMTGLAFLSLALMHWVSLRWRSFSVAVGFGIVAIVTSFAMLLAAGQYGAWPQYFPWSLPVLVVARQSQDMGRVLWISGLVGLLAVVAGCMEFSRREVT